MAHQRSAKRLRTNQGGAYHDAVPVFEEFSTVHASEGRLINIGNDRLFTAPMQRIPEQDAGFWDKVSEWTPPDDLEFALDPNGQSYEDALEMDVMESTPTAAAASSEKKKRSQVSRRPHVVWKEQQRQTYLDEILRWAGRGDFRTASQCPDCVARSVESPAAPEYRCRECFLPDLVCRTCCVRRHRSHPFHRIEKWGGLRFSKVSLKSLGLKLQLNHASMYCESPAICHASMLVLHTNGIHEVDIRYCACMRAIPNHIQLLRRGLYPASQITVKTCATFELLGHLHMLALTTKGNTYDFYRMLEKSTNNTGMDVPKSRYRALFRMVLQWRHLQMLKWGGRGHDTAGVNGTQPGELAVQCPSCPIPGVNLADGWQEVPEGMKFLYMMVLCMDANFRLKNQLVSNYSQDPGLGVGWAYMVPRKPYEAYVLSRASDEDISTCVGFQALAKANSKFSAGLRYTGVGLAVCGRSEMILPMGVGNLQKGERYANMDYIFGSALQSVAVPLILISYDIACQWFINLFKRMEEHWPEGIKPHPDATLTPAIPKLHEPMHETAGHQVFSLNYIKGCGLSDCECPERVWASHNSLANSTKTQGPGSRQDVLDDHFGFWNWLKYIDLGKTLLRRYKAAVAQRNVQQEGHRGLTQSLDVQLVKGWESMCIDWDLDGFPKRKENPYHREDDYISEAQVKKELAAEEERRLASGGLSLHVTSAPSFIQMGLDLEDTQYRLRRLAKANGSKLNATAGQERTVIEERNTFRVRLRAWEKLLPIYLPGLLQYVTEVASNRPPLPNVPQSDKIEDTDLWLPSRVPLAVRARVCQSGLPLIEERLRDAQCTDSLNKIRQILKVKSRMVHFKNKNVRGQREGTRSRAVIDRIHQNARNAAEKYRVARRAKLSLGGPGKWEEMLQVLEDRDIRGYQDPNHLRPRVGRRGVLDDEQLVSQSQAASSPEAAAEVEGEFELFNEQRTRRDGTGETRRTLSWIWIRAPSSPSEDHGDNILRVEWAKSRARAARATEEVLLLKEEMRRVLAFLDWKATWWEARENTRSGLSKELSEGVRSYALTQKGLQEKLAAHFRGLWRTPLADSEDAPENDRGPDAEDEDDDDENEDLDDFSAGVSEDEGEEDDI